MKTLFFFSLFLIHTILINICSARALEMQGLISYNLGKVSPEPTRYQNISNGIGYTFLGRFDLGPGQVETGFQFIPTSIALNETIGEVKYTGSHWILPLVYRFHFLPPFFSLGVGVDYAVVGTSNIVVKGVTSASDAYKSHFGAQASLQATQDLGENISAVLDLRYRSSMGNAVQINEVGSKYSIWAISLGIQKHLD
jgi:hypothetical protein